MTESDIYQLVGEAYCNGMAHGMEKSASMHKSASTKSKLLSAALSPEAWTTTGVGIGGLNSYLNDEPIVNGVVKGGLTGMLGNAGMRLGAGLGGVAGGLGGAFLKSKNETEALGKMLLSGLGGAAVGAPVGAVAGGKLADVVANWAIDK